jgi:manganese/zinc/iron transport system permease protein
MIPPFHPSEVFLTPWREPQFEITLWMVTMGALVAITCGLIGVFLQLRRLSMAGDAVSHSLLPGLVGAYVISGGLSLGAMVIGALASGLLTAWLIEFIHSQTRLKTDAAIGITFTTLFALGVLGVHVYADHIDLDADCVLYGDLSHVWTTLGWLDVPVDVWRMLGVLSLVLSLLRLFYKELLTASFDGPLAQSLGFSPRLIHYSLMTMVSLVSVAAFQAVGAIMGVGMLILPGACARLWPVRLPAVLALSTGYGLLATVLGIHFGQWFDCSTAAAIVVMAGALFALTWLLRTSLVRARRASA